MMHLAFNDVKLLACLVDRQADRETHSCCAHINYADCEDPKRRCYTHTPHSALIFWFSTLSLYLLTFPNGFHVVCVYVCRSLLREFRVNLRPQRIIEFFHLYFLRIYFHFIYSTFLGSFSVSFYFFWKGLTSNYHEISLRI